MKTFSIRISWNHKGTKYQKYVRLTIDASSAKVAATRALKIVKQTNKGSWREPIGAEISMNLLVIEPREKEASDGRRVRDEQQEEQEGGSRGDA